MKENRKKLLISNILIFGFGGIISKAVPLVMVPIVTRLMPSTFYYGISDLTTTIVSLFCAFAGMGMYDAMYRMFFEKEDEQYKKEICSNAIFFVLISSMVVSFFMIIFRHSIAALFYSDASYGNLVILAAVSVFVGASNTIISAPTRMQNKRMTYLVANTLTPIISYGLAIPLLLKGYYLLALPLSTLLSSFTILIAFYFLNKEFFNIRLFNWKHIKDMLIIALPLVPNFLIYWIFNSSDRVMISNIMGPAYSGIYAVASKIGHISQLIYTAFAGGWQYFAFSVMKDDDSVDVISKVFEILALLMMVTTLIGTTICKFGVELLFEPEYYESYICVPYLYMAPLMLMLFQIGSNQFIVIKKTWPNLIILSTGAATNIILNLLLIPRIGTEGASIATFTGYLLAVSVCICVLMRLKLLSISKKLTIAVVLFAMAFIIMRLNSFSVYLENMIVLLVYILLLAWMYWPEMISAVSLKRKKE